MKKITKNTKLSEVLEIKGAEKILLKYGVPCLHCPMASMELGFLKLGDICKTYGIDANKLIKELNKLL